MKVIIKMGIVSSLVILCVVAPVMAAGSTIKLPSGQWQNTASLVTGYSSGSNQQVIPTPTYTQNTASLLRGYSFVSNQQVVIPTPTYTENDNGKTIALARDAIVKIQLNENPTTGFSWQITTTPGLQVLSTSFQPSATGRFGAGGTRTWVLKATGTGILKFSGIYKQPWVPNTGFETTYAVTFNTR